MKLRNKKTGEITSNYDLVAIQGIDMDKGIDYICLQTEDGKKYVYYSLADFNAEWEDFKESKEGAIEEIIRKLEADFEMYPSEWNNLEEAKKVVEKLKAWAKLKDARIRVDTLDFGGEE